MGATASKAKCDAPPPLPPPGGISPTLPPLDSEDHDNNATSSNVSQKASETISNVTSNQDNSIIFNPGPYEVAMVPCKRLTNLDTYSGFRVDIQKPLSPFMVAIHSFQLGTSTPDGMNKGYNFITQVADEEGILMVNFDPFRQSVMGRVHKSLLGGAAMAKVSCNISPDGSNDQLMGEMDIGGATWSGNLKYGSMGGGIVLGMNYYQAITNRLSMGGEGMYIGVNGNQITSYTLKYECDAKGGDSDDGVSNTAGSSSTGKNPSKVQPSSWFGAQLSPAQGMLGLHYKRIVTPNRVTLGAELNVDAALQSTVSLGGEFNLTRSKVNFAVDGTGKIQSLLEAKLGMGQGAPTLNFSAECDYASDSMKFGYGLNIG
jgi:mitochondrial import receptor subunit TOM40